MAPGFLQWNLEFADPGLEDAFKLWFNSLQTKTGGAPQQRARLSRAGPRQPCSCRNAGRMLPAAYFVQCTTCRAGVGPALSAAVSCPSRCSLPPADLAVFRWFSLLLLLLAVALAARGGTSLGDLLAMTHGAGQSQCGEAARRLHGRCHGKGV